MKLPLLFALSVLASLAIGCGNDTPTVDEIGIASQCQVDADCPTFQTAGDAGVVQLRCLLQFRGGYCGLPDCVSSADCPDLSICVAHDDGNNYCFRTCDDKPECNANRSIENEANCSSSFDWATPSDDAGEKACVPPSA